MKAYLALISAAVIGLAACSQEAAKPAEAPAASAASEAAPAETTAPADAAPASEAAPADAAAGNCATTVEANDAMQFNTKEIQVSKACKEFTITLKHTGTQPKESMGHNIVIGKAEDMDGIFKDGAGAAATDYVTQRREADQVEILSGVFEGKTTGTPIALLIRNTDQRSKDYGNIATSFRPGHADYTYWHKYGTRDYRGGGRSSARETAARVAAGAVAKKWLKEKFGTEITAYVTQVGEKEIQFEGYEYISQNPFFCRQPKPN